MTDMWTGTSLFISPEFIPKKYLGQDEIGILSTQRCKKKKKRGPDTLVSISLSIPDQIIIRILAKIDINNIWRKKKLKFFYKKHSSYPQY